MIFSGICLIIIAVMIIWYIFNSNADEMWIMLAAILMIVGMICICIRSIL